MKNYLYGILTIALLLNALAFCFMLGAYRAGNVINVVTVPREMQVYASTPEEMRAIEASADSFPYAAQPKHR